MRDLPRLNWLTGKLFKSSTGGRKNRSGYSYEHVMANAENLNPYQSDGRWYFVDENGVPSEQSYLTRDQAVIALNDKKGLDVRTT